MTISVNPQKPPSDRSADPATIQTKEQPKVTVGSLRRSDNETNKGTAINSIKSGDMCGGFDTLLALLGLQKGKRKPCRSRLVKKPLLFGEAAFGG